MSASTVQPQVETPPYPNYSRRPPEMLAARWTRMRVMRIYLTVIAAPEGEPDKDRLKKTVTENPRREKWTSQS